MVSWNEKASALIHSVSPKKQVDLNDFYQERAAIIEYDGGLPRDLAEKAAYKELIGEHKRVTNK